MVLMADMGGARTLATIVFTDTVGFSRLAGLNEASALSLLGRDLEAMKAACAARGGRVLNQTGDGLLLMFGSAVEGMRCALDIQGQIAERIKTLPPDQVLHHRIGLHVGDIVFEGDNILGDGVNIAARLQSEAKPDSICFSRTVYDLIKNKVEINATYLGPRALKNIAERVPVWQFNLPLDSAPTAGPSFDPVPEEVGASGTKGVAMIAGSGALVLVLLFLIFRLWPSIQASTRISPGPTAATIPDPSPGDIQPKKSDNPSKATSPSEDQVRTQISTLTEQYRFDDLVGLLKSSGEAEKANGPGEIQRFEALAEMWKWLQTASSQIPQDNPIQANIDIGTGAEVPCKIYSTPDGLAIDPGSGPSLKKLEELRPSSIYNLGSALAQLPGANPQAEAWLNAFQEEYSSTGQKS
jgi:class 3 adenylate cyclase